MISTYQYKNVIRTSDRATTIDLLQALDGYSIGIGTVGDETSVNGIQTVKIKTEERIHVGYLIRKGSQLSDIAEKFVAYFKNSMTHYSHEMV